MARRRLGYRWRLREVMGSRGLWHTTELRPLLMERGIDLSPAQVHRLVTQTPERLSLRTLMALCDALECEMNDLLERVAEEPPKRRRAAGAPGPADADVLPLRPKPARIVPRAEAVTRTRPREPCLDCHRLMPRIRLVDGGRVCMGCFADRRRRPCPSCGELRPPWRRTPGTRFGLCVARDSAAAKLAGDRDRIVDAVLVIDPALSAADVAAAVEDATSQREQRRILAESVTTDPQWATGSTIAPVAVERLVQRLNELGGVGFEFPRCGECGRAARCVGRTAAGARLCKACDHRRRTGDCSRCDRHRPVAFHLDDGAVLCGSCARRHPRRLEPCSDCGRTWIVHRRTAGGEAICPRCYMRRARALEAVPGLSAVCIDCGHHGFCIGVTTGQPRCHRCYPQRTSTCVRCGQLKRVAAVWAAGEHCDGCREQVLDSRGICDGCGDVRRIDPRNRDARRLCTSCAGLEPFSTCTSCASEARLRDRGLCITCVLQRRLDELFDIATVEIAARLAPLRASLTVPGSHRSTLDWLDRRGTVLLSGLFHGTIPIEHRAFDQLASQPAEHLRHLLIAAGILPARDEHVARLERWIDRQLAGIDNAEDRHLVETFATWHILRRRRQRAQPATELTSDRRTITSTIELLAWLRAQRRPLAEITQTDIDRWLTTGPRRKHTVRRFLLWAHARRLARAVDIASPSVKPPTAAITNAELREFVHRLATDTSLSTVDRVGGLLVALYGQPATRIARLAVTDVTILDDAVLLRLGRHDVELPPVLAGLVTELLADRRGVARTGNPCTSRWLFAGAQPGRPLTAHWLAARIAAHGLPVKATRTATMLGLAAELPAAFLADLLGLSPTTAVRWTQVAGGEWANYAAVRTRRS